VPLVGTLQAFAIYFVGFLARPIGAAIFGHYGDRVGRKSTLIVTLVVMGVATFLVGLVPSYAVIGIWGAITLTVLRFVQGIGVGGEWGGSVLLAMEWGRTDKHRGFIAAMPQLGLPVGLFLATLAVLLFSRMSGRVIFGVGLADTLPDQHRPGWRRLYIRIGILETPKFAALSEGNKLARQPVLEVLRKHPKDILLSALARTGQQAPFYIFTAFVFSYGTSVLGMSRDFLLTALLVASAMSCITNPLFGHLSDLFGRKRTYLTGVVLTAFTRSGILRSSTPAHRCWCFSRSPCHSFRMI
jgi:MFS family permease